jgi:predicted RNA-binding Zn-ribbon protein involved in translation (DUF1610 family)
MFHCPECTTVLTRAEGARRANDAQSGIALKTHHYDCPGCGQQYLHWQHEFANHEPVDRWFHFDASGKTLLMHNPPEF